jgi:hypothetical protein
MFQYAQGSSSDLTSLKTAAAAAWAQRQQQQRHSQGCACDHVLDCARQQLKFH